MADPKAIPMRDFGASLPMALLRAREAVMDEFRPNLALHGITEQQWRVLRALAADDARDGIGVTELADRVLLLGPSLSRILATLEERGAIQRTADAHDARRATISITSQGLGIVRRVAPRAEEIYGGIEERFGGERLARLIAELNDLAEQEEAHAHAAPDPADTPTARPNTRPRRQRP